MQVDLTGPEQGHHRWSVAFEGDRPDGAELTYAVQLAASQVAERGGGRLQVWVEDADDSDDHALAGAGFEPYRDLWQLRCPLPAEPTDLEVRSFRPSDAKDFLRVNNAAFDWHPEQGNMTIDGLNERLAEPWYDPNGFLLHHRDGELAAFCWTKIHGDVDPALGEIYAIAVDPSLAGSGLGTAMALAGLQWLVEQDLTVGMLFVESDNAAANAVYARIGFTHHSTNRAYEALIVDE